MAASSQQPEMAELAASSVLPGESALQQSATSEASTGIPAAATLPGPTTATQAHTLNPVDPSAAPPQMHTVIPEAGGIVRGADNEAPPAAASTEFDNATIASAEAEEASKAVPTMAHIRSHSDKPSLSAGQDVLPKSTASHGRPLESQEKGDLVTVELLLLSGSRKRFTFNSSMTVNEVLAWVFKDWPTEWEEQKPRELSQLRLLHRGQFLQGPSKLSAHRAEDSPVMVMHLNIRPSEGTESIKPKRTKTPSTKPAGTDTHGGGCCSSCIIS